MIAGFLSVQRLEAAELERWSPAESLGARGAAPGSTGVSARMLEAQLSGGAEVTVELCGAAPLPADPALQLVVWEPAAGRLLSRQSLAEIAARARPEGVGAVCSLVVSGAVPASGSYAVDFAWPGTELGRMNAAVLRVRMVARPVLSSWERFPAVWLLIGSILLFLVLAVPAPPADRSGGLDAENGNEADESGPPSVVDVVEPPVHPSVFRSLVVAGAGVALVMGLVIALMWIPTSGPSMSLVRGLMLAVVECVVAVWLARVLSSGEGVRRTLGLSTPRVRVLYALGAVAGAVIMLPLIARIALSFIPSTEAAPIETFVSWPSGLVSFALLACMVPPAEELFFRGLVFGAMQRFGVAVACAAAWTSFVAAHMPQVWGSWGSLASVAITGAVLTGLRAWTGTTTVPALVHLGYNGTLALSGLF